MAKLKLQNLDQYQKIVTPDGAPSQYFVRFIQDRGGSLTDLEALITLLQAAVEALQQDVDDLENIDIVAGDYLSGGGLLGDGLPITLDHDTSGVAPGTYGDSTNVAQITVDEFGHITDVTEVAIAGGGGGSIEAYYARDTTSSSTGTVPASQTIYYSLVIPASGTARTFAVSGGIVWDNNHGMRWSIQLDGVRNFPNTMQSSNPGIDCVVTGDGMDNIMFAGIPIVIPGDGAPHTISIAWEAQSSTSALTVRDKYITAIKIA